jgi:transcription elongation GreA/GreB family factor
MKVGVGTATAVRLISAPAWCWCEDAMYDSQNLPPILIAACDYDRLMFTALSARRRGDRNAEFLLRELLRARRCEVEELPDDVVSTNCRVTYRVSGEERRACLLVHPQDMRCRGAELSVATPLGTALRCLRVGDRMPYSSGAGPTEHEVVVEGVGRRFLSAANWRERREDL